MKKILFVFTFFLFAQSLYAIGFGDWSYETNNGSSIEEPGGGTRLWNNNSELDDLTKWYFYKNHIIGEYRPDINDDAEIGYFILNELNGELKTYNNKQTFDNTLRTKELVPLFWTRWYYDHFMFVQGIYILWLFYWPILSGIGLFVCLCIWGAVASKNIILKIIFIVITLIITLPPTLLIINDYWTSSI